MFCSFCGAGFRPDQRFCGSCGRSTGVGLAAAAPGAPPGVQRARVTRHVRLLGVLWIVLSALQLLRAGGTLIGARMIRFAGYNWFSDMGWGWPAGHFLRDVISVVGVAALVVAIAGFALAVGLLERRPWARTLAIIAGVLALLHPPLGTALGIYTLWVFLPADSEEEWRRMAGVY